MSDFTSLKTPGSIGDAQLTEQIRTNLCAFLDWGILGLGGFFNVYKTDTSPYGGNPSKLRLSDDARFRRGTAWDSFKTNWVWENNTDYNIQPIQISGVYVNNVFIPVTGGQYNIDYLRGRVLFNSPIAVNSNVQIEYSFKYYNIYPDSVQWFKQLTERTFRLDDAQFNSQGSGIWSIYPESRAQLPAIVVEPVPNRSWTGMGLGGGQYLYNDVVFHVFAEDVAARDNIIDILTYQNTKKFFMFDKNAINRSGVYPLNSLGYLVNPSSTYPYLIDNYAWRYAIVMDTTSTNLVNDPQSIYNGTARWTIQFSFPEI